MGPNFAVTRDNIMAGAVYLGQVPQNVTFDQIRRQAVSMKTGGVHLETMDDIDNFIWCLLHSKSGKILYPYMSLESNEPVGLSGMLKIRCDNLVMDFDANGKATGRFMEINKFYSSPLPILDLRGEVITDKDFHTIPAYTGPR
ncbi:hypothetical protein NMY22_g10947 [Coprinellus aureogranulatus]|nr:hypothetical protein NMY22_g10947 [Coprinellus aureogranulatus]